MKKLLFLLLLPLSLFAQLVKEISPSSHINDYVDVLSRDQTGSLAEKVFFIERTYNVSIRILLIKSLEGNTIENFAKTIGNEWHVGDQGSSNNGIVYVASLEDRKQRLDLSINMQQRITVNPAKEITDAITAHFKSGHYYEGLYAMLSTMQAVLEINQSMPPIPNRNSAWYALLTTGVMVLIVYLLTLYIRKKRHNKAISQYYSPESMTNSEHTPYPHRMKERSEDRTHRIDRSDPKRPKIVITDYQSQMVSEVMLTPEPDNTLTNIIIAEEILSSNNASIGYDTSGSQSSNDYSSSASSSSDYSSSGSDYSSSSSDSSSSYDSSSSSSSDSGSSFDGGGGSSGDF